MAKFIDLGTAIVNTNFIIRVEMASNGRAEIYMSDGTMFPLQSLQHLRSV